MLQFTIDGALLIIVGILDLLDLHVAIHDLNVWDLQQRIRSIVLYDGTAASQLNNQAIYDHAYVVVEEVLLHLMRQLFEVLHVTIHHVQQQI